MEETLGGLAVVGSFMVGIGGDDDNGLNLTARIFTMFSNPNVVSDLTKVSDLAINYLPVPDLILLLLPSLRFRRHRQDGGHC